MGSISNKMETVLCLQDHFHRDRLRTRPADRESDRTIKIEGHAVDTLISYIVDDCLVPCLIFNALLSKKITNYQLLIELWSDIGIGIGIGYRRFSVFSIGNSSLVISN